MCIISVHIHGICLEPVSMPVTFGSELADNLGRVAEQTHLLYYSIYRLAEYPSIALQMPRVEKSYL